MAVITAAKEQLQTVGDEVLIFTFANMANGDSGLALERPGSADRSVQVEGTFGSGGNVVIEGSNDGTNYRVLTDPQGNGLNFTSAKIESVMEITRYIRPRVTAGDGTTLLTVSILMRRVSR